MVDVSFELWQGYISKVEFARSNLQEVIRKK